jgi:DNA-binding transcriptional ArsR family regulator
MPATEEQLLAVLTAVANPQRLRIIAALADGRVHVSELARRLGMSRPLLYMHLDKLEKASLLAAIEFGDPDLHLKVDEILAKGFGAQ